MSKIGFVVLALYISLLNVSHAGEEIERDYITSDVTQNHLRATEVPGYIRDITFVVTTNKGQYFIAPCQESDIKRVLKYGLGKSQEVSASSVSGDQQTQESFEEDSEYNKMKESLLKGINDPHPTGVVYLVYNSLNLDEVIGDIPLYLTGLFNNAVYFTINLKTEYQKKGIRTAITRQLLKFLREYSLQATNNILIQYVGASSSKVDVPQNTYMRMGGMVQLESHPHLFYYPLKDNLPTPTLLSPHETHFDMSNF